VLWHALGPDGLKRWHRTLRERGIREVTGNATVKNLVAAGTLDFGFTDTDDFFVARDDGAPVKMFPVRTPDGKVISIPNTVCIIRGTKQPDAARKLVDYLLSETVELELAASKSRQIPLGPVDETRLDPDVRRLKHWAADPSGNPETPSGSRGPDVSGLRPPKSPTRHSRYGDGTGSGTQAGLTKLAEARRDCLAWLRSEYLK